MLLRPVCLQTQDKTAWIFFFQIPGFFPSVSSSPCLRALAPLAPLAIVLQAHLRSFTKGGTSARAELAIPNAHS